MTTQEKIDWIKWCLETKEHSCQINKIDETITMPLSLLFDINILFLKKTTEEKEAVIETLRNSMEKIKAICNPEEITHADFYNCATETLSATEPEKVPPCSTDGCGNGAEKAGEKCGVCQFFNK